MGKEKKEDQALLDTSLSGDQNPDGVNFDANKMIEDNSEAKTVIKYAERVTVKLLKDTVYQKAGKVYSPHKIKADALVEQGIAEYVK